MVTTNFLNICWVLATLVLMTCATGTWVVVFGELRDNGPDVAALSGVGCAFTFLAVLNLALFITYPPWS
jgi:hypothetical protein